MTKTLQCWKTGDSWVAQGWEQARQEALDLVQRKILRAQNIQARTTNQLLKTVISEQVVTLKYLGEDIQRMKYKEKSNGETEKK